MGGEAVPQARHVDETGERDGVGLQHVDLPGPAAALETVEDRLGRVVTHEVGDRPVHHEAGGRRRGPERAVGQRLRRDLAEPMVEHAEPPRQRADDRHLFGRVAGHDLAVLLVGGLPAELDGEEADVVGDEPVHRRLPARRRRVVGATISVASLKRLASSRMLNSWVLVCGYSSPGSGSGMSIPAEIAVWHDPALCAVLGPGRDRVAEVLADHPFERLDLSGRVEAPEQIVERPVLEEHEHHVVHRILSCWRHLLPRRARRVPGGRRGARTYATAALFWPRPMGSCDRSRDGGRWA